VKRVIVESPFAAEDKETFEQHMLYLSLALRDCLERGEAPFASHAIYTRDGVLDDLVPSEREWGIQAGFAWGNVAEATVVYTDCGISRGMQYGIEAAEKAGRPVEHRSIRAKMATALAAEAVVKHMSQGGYKDSKYGLDFKRQQMRERVAAEE